MKEERLQRYLDGDTDFSAAEIKAAVGRPEVMATSTSKVIDNAIMGFVRMNRPSK